MKKMRTLKGKYDKIFTEFRSHTLVDVLQCCISGHCTGSGQEHISVLMESVVVLF